MNKKAVLEKGLAEFIFRFENENEHIKKQVHFNSVQNIICGFIKIWNKPECEKFIFQIVEYLEEVKRTDYPITKTVSAYHHQKYLFPGGSYLIKNKDFITKANFKANIIWGLILDTLLYLVSDIFLNFYFPIFTPLLTFLGYLKQKKAIKEKKIFGIFW